jgi:arylsulfatase A-like enzyme
MAVGTATTVLSSHAKSVFSANEPNPGKRPNILFFFTDDQRYDTIHALGNEEIITPNMDALVQEGVAFTHAYIMGSMVGAVCVPSRAMLMSGRTLFHVPNDLADTLTFPEVFRRAGYVTFGTGKWHNGPAAFARGFTAGAKIFFGGMSDHLKVPVHDFDPTGRYPKEKSYIGEKFSSELFSDAAIKFLREYEGDRPFLMYVSYTAPHDPRMAPKEFADMYDPERISLPRNFMPEHPFDNGELRIRDEKLAPWPRTPEIVRRHIADYYAMISHLDEQIGRVLEALRETGHAENTIIIFAGDNGLAVGQHGLLGKQSLYEHSVRVPLIINGPGIPKGKRSDALCYLLDIFPTLCELTGLPIPETVEGKSLAPVIMGEKRKIRDSLFFAYKNFQRAVRNGRYKLIEYFVGDTRRTQLFDLADDPWEVNDLSGDPEHSDHLARLREEMVGWQEKVEDPLLVG